MVRRTDPDKPFLDIEGGTDSFKIPRRKWRELLFVGALVPDGEEYVRDASRPLPAFRIPDLFPTGARFRVREDGEHVHIERVGPPSQAGTALSSGQ
jgi:hypothetical protein